MRCDLKCDESTTAGDGVRQCVCISEHACVHLIEAEGPVYPKFEIHLDPMVIGWDATQL